jgi:3-deoxy-7-phosphoheptulonate synthase
LAGIAAGADGLIIEIHPSPDHAMSDGAQSLDFAQFAAMMPKVKAVAEAVDRTLTLPSETSVAERETAAV